MSEQALDLRRSFRIAWRYRIVVAVAIAVGLLGGATYTALKPPTHASTALVVLPASIQGPSTQTTPTQDASTEELIADSVPVVTDALRSAHLNMSVQELRGQVQVSSVTTNVLSITAHGKTATEAKTAANAVANSYVAYVSAPGSPGGRISAKVLQTAASASGVPLPVNLAINALVGALIGFVLGTGIALWIGKGDKRLRTRDEIADSIGVPVFLSVPVEHPSTNAGWARLLAEYAPGVVDAWRLRKALYDLDVANVAQARPDTSPKVLSVLSLSRDRGALALGPQLAVFAATLGIPTCLVLDRQQVPGGDTALRAVCEAAVNGSSGTTGNAKLHVTTEASGGLPRGTALAVVVAVVDARVPRVAETARADVTVLGVSSGIATAVELAQVAVSAADAGRRVAGVFLADPDPADRTTGRMPQVTPRALPSMPTRLSGSTVRTRP